MNDLFALQNDFQNYILNEDDSIKNQIVSTRKVNNELRLAVYANAYRLRLIEALEETYSVLHTLLGCEQFNELVAHYLNDHPSTFRSIRWFGNQLSDFLKQTSPYADEPAFSEMAQFEWALTEAFDAANSAIITVEHMAEVPPEKWPQLQLSAHASVRRLNLQWNIVPIWNQITEKPEEEHSLEFEQAEYPIAWLIWRKDLQTLFRSMPVEEAWALDTMLRGESFEAVCIGLCEWIGEQHVAAHAAGLLKTWIVDGLVSEIMI